MGDENILLIKKQSKFATDSNDFRIFSHLFRLRFCSGAGEGCKVYNPFV